MLGFVLPLQALHQAKTKRKNMKRNVATNVNCAFKYNNQAWGGFDKAIYALRLKFARCAHPFCPNLP
jgi:hypothetical protein